MAFQPAPACAQVTLRFVRAADGVFIGANTPVLHKPGGTAFTQADVDAVRDAVLAWWGTDLSPITAQAAQLASVTVRGLASSEDVISTVTSGDDGVQVGDLLPSSVTLAIAFKTGLTGRSARGRVFMCGMVESQVASNTATLAYATAARDAWAAFGLQLESEGYDHVVLSRVSGGVKRENALPRKVTTYEFTDRRVDTMRDRLADS